MSWVNKRFGVEPAPKPQTASGWVSQRYASTEPNQEEADSPGAPAGWVQQRFAAPMPSQKPSTGKKVAGIPYPVAPPETNESGFFQTAKDVILGPAQGPLSKPGEDIAYEKAKKKAYEATIDPAKAAVESNVATRALGRSGIAVGALLQNTILRPLEWLGLKKAGKVADQTNRALQDLRHEDTKKTAQGWIAKNMGEGVARGVDTITESLGSAFLAGTAGKAAGAAKSSLPIFFGASSADQALTEAEDIGLKGKAKGAYAAGVGGFEAALMMMGGGIAKKLGLETAEEALFSEVRPAIAELLGKHGVKQAFTELGKAAAGASIEAGEEGMTTLSQEVWKSIFAGPEDSAAERVLAKLQDKNLWKSVGEAAAIGAGSRGAFGAANQLADGLQTAIGELPNVVKRIAGQKSGQTATEAAPGAPVAATAEAGAPAAPSAGTAVPTAPADAMAQAPSGPAAALPAEVAAEAQIPTETPPAGPAEPPERRPPSDFEPPIPGVSPQNAAMAKMAKKLFGRDIPYGSEHVAWDQSVDMAAHAKIPERALEIATSVKAAPRELSHVETAGLATRLVGLEQEYNAAHVKGLQASEANDPATAKIQAGEASRLEQEFFTIREALLKAGSEQGRNFAARKMTLGQDYSVLPVLGRYQATKQEALTPSEKASMTMLVESHNKLDTDATAARAKQREDITSEFIRKVKETGVPTEDTTVLHEKLKQFFDLGCDLE